MGSSVAYSEAQCELSPGEKSVLEDFRLPHIMIITDDLLVYHILRAEFISHRSTKAHFPVDL
jgi:hypothetical protein